MSIVTIDLSDDDDLDELPDFNLGSGSSITSKPASSPSSSNSASQSSEVSVGKENNTTKKRGAKRNRAGEQQQLKQTQKIYKPGECMKHMVLEMHPNLMDSWYCADLPREVSASGARIKVNSELCDNRLVLWSRMVDPTLANRDGVVTLTPVKEPTAHGVYVTRLEDIQDLIRFQSLSQHMLSASELAGSKLTLVLFGVKDYFKTTGHKKNSNQNPIQSIDLEMALTGIAILYSYLTKRTGKTKASERIIQSFKS